LRDEHQRARHGWTHRTDRADAISVDHTAQSEHVSDLDADDHTADVVRSAADFSAAE
jgi:hypothetical protein